MEVIENIAHRLLTKRHTLWLGAGISLSSGVPTVDVLRRYILQGLGLHESDIKEYEHTKPPFESLFEVLLSVSDCRKLLEVFRGSHPGVCHHVVAQMAKRGLVRTICTTNFDTLLENALSIYSVNFDVYSSDDSLLAVNWSSQNVRTVKMHGTIADLNALSLTIARIAARKRMDIRHNIISEIIDNTDDGGLVVLGYSCSDHFDINPALRTLARPDKCVLYISHSESGSTPSIVALDESHPDNPFADFNAVSVTCVTDDLLTVLWRELFVSEPPRVNPTAEWKSTIDDWLSELDLIGTRNFRPYIAGLVLKSANLWMQSNKYLLQSIDDTLPEHATLRAFLAMGNNYRDLGHYDEAETKLYAALKLAEKQGQLRRKARALNSLGIVAEDQCKHGGAIEFYLRSLALARETGDEELEGKCHGNLGISYKNRQNAGDLLSALEHHRLALKIAIDIGDKRSEGRTLGNIGLVYSAMDEIGEAVRYYNDARRVAESLGDLLHVGIWLINAGEDLIAGEPDTARGLLSRAKTIFGNLEQDKYKRMAEELMKQVENA